MRASVVVPVWNGTSIVLDCLQTLYQNSGEALLEVICVDNASSDDSAALIAEHYPQVKLYRQPVNLGFAGGVNAGIDSAQGDVFVLLNQDCLVQPDWLDHILSALTEFPNWGIAGCTLLNADGQVEHAGAFLNHPQVRGVHYVEFPSNTPHTVGYVTGALFAIRRTLWEKIGPLDEEYYPAYYEETDYCYRARHAGYEIGYVPQAKAIHLRSSHEWQLDTFLHSANQELSRYRFVAKHLSEEEIAAFAAYEQDAIKQNLYFDQAVGHAVAARKTVRYLSDILAQRNQDLAVQPSRRRYRLLQTTFRRIMHRSILTAQQLSLSDLLEQTEEEQRRYEDETSATARILALLEPQNHGLMPLPDLPDLDLQTWSWESIQQNLRPTLPAPIPVSEIQARLQILKQQEYEIIQKIHFRSPQSAASEAVWQKLGRYLLRVLSFVSGREYVLQSHLNAVHTARMDELQQVVELQHTTILSLYESNNAFAQSVSQWDTMGVHMYKVLQETLQTLHETLHDSSSQQVKTLKQLHRRLQLLELLTDYDYR